MNDLTRIDFEEHAGQWLVTLVDAENNHAPGEPFPAFGGEGLSKLEQVLLRVEEMGFRATRIPYNKPNATRYILEVVPQMGS